MKQNFKECFNDSTSISRPTRSHWRESSEQRRYSINGDSIARPYRTPLSWRCRVVLNECAKSPIHLSNGISNVKSAARQKSAPEGTAFQTSIEMRSTYSFTVFTSLDRTGHTGRGSATLSGFMQGWGYVLAAVGPIFFGKLHAWSGRWTESFLLLMGMSVPMALCARPANRPVYLADCAHETS